MSDEELNAEIGGQKFSIKSPSVNGLFTILTFVIVALIGYVLVTHATESKDAAKEFVAAMKEMTQAMRQNNCLNEFPPERREANAELCKRLTR